MLLIILLVMYIVLMLLWGLALLGAIPPGGRDYPGWLAFFAALILGIVVFLVGSGQASLPR